MDVETKVQVINVLDLKEGPKQYQNSLIQYYAWCRIKSTSLGVWKWTSVSIDSMRVDKPRSPLTKETVITYLNEVASKYSVGGEYERIIDTAFREGTLSVEKVTDEKDRLLKWYHFYAILAGNWRLFVFLDFMHTYRIYYGPEGSKDFCIVQEGANGVRLVKVGTTKSLVPEYVQKQYLTLILDKKAIAEKDAKWSLYKTLFATPNDFYFTKKGGWANTKPVFKLCNTLSNHFATVIPQPLVATTATATTTTTTTTTTNTEPVAKRARKASTTIVNTVGGVKNGLVSHKILLIHIDRIKALGDTRIMDTRLPDEYALLPYLVEYSVENSALIKLLCVCAHNHSVAFLTSEEENDTTSIDEMFRELPRHPYHALLPVESSHVAYRNHFLVVVLAPLFYRCLWTRIIRKITASCGFPIGKEIPALRMPLTYEMANHLQRQIRSIDVYLRETRGFIDAGLDMRVIDQIMDLYFECDEKSRLSDSSNLRIDTTRTTFRQWDYTKMKERCVKEVARLAQTMQSNIKKADCVDMMSDNLLIENYGSNARNSRLDEIVLGDKKAANRCLYESVILARALAPRKNLRVASVVRRHILSYSDLFNIFVVGATRAHATRLERLFTFDLTRDTNELYDLVSQLLANIPAFVPRVEYVCDFDEFVVNENETIGELRRRLTGLINLPPTVAHSQYMVNMKALKSFRLVDGDAADMTHHMDADDWIITEESRYTLFLYYEAYAWVPLRTEVDRLRSPTICYIERRNDGTPVSFESLSMDLLLRPASVTKMRQLLPLTMSIDSDSITQFDFHFMATTASIMIVVDVQEGGQEQATLYEPQREERLVRLLQMYEARVASVDIGTLYHPEAIELSPGDMPVVEPVDDGTPMTAETYDGVVSFYRELRGLLFLRKEELVNIVMMPRRIPYITRDANNVDSVVRTTLVDIEAGLFNGVLVLREQTSGSIRRITVEKLILLIEQRLPLLSDFQIRTNIMLT